MRVTVINTQHISHVSTATFGMVFTESLCQSIAFINISIIYVYFHVNVWVFNILSYFKFRHNLLHLALSTHFKENFEV